jgi:UDP-N-acetylglucosamine:LPS N-acetylglucosamine transferase
LIDAVNDLLNDREKLARIGFNAKKMAKLDAKEKICNEILE